MVAAVITLMTTAVPGPAVDPVRVHQPPAQPPPDQSSKHVPADNPVVVHARGPDLLDGHEVRLAHQCWVRQRLRKRPLGGDHPTSPTRRRALVATPDLPAGVARVRQNHRHRPQVPRLPAAVTIPSGIRRRRAQHTALVQLASDPGHTATGKSLGEDPPHMPRGHRIRIQPLPPPPRRVRPIRMRPGEPYPIRLVNWFMSK
ncbi:MAG: hypothetical protein QOI50_80 [Pseudonocardiales bacterium]|nr:hypothetical protein [Pseudonocardiales bacterium]